MIVEYKGETYETKMTRAGVRAAEAAGLSAQDIASKPFSSLPLLLFAGLFSVVKGGFNPNKANDILDKMLDDGDTTVGDALQELTEAYSELFDSGESETKDA